MHPWFHRPCTDSSALHTRSARRRGLCAAAAASLYAVVLALAGCAARRGDTEVRAPSRELGLEGEGFLKVYDSGLRLFVAPDPYTRLVQLDVRHQVGTRDDPAGRHGLAHLVEHLMFEQLAHGPGSVSVMSELQEHALSFNAYTSLDHTHYSNTGTLDDIDTYLRHTAMRLRFDCAALDQDTFERAREVVRNESRWRRRSSGMELRSQILAEIFPEAHPYRRDLRNEDAQLAAITREDACAFIQQHYTTDRTTVVVTGNATPEDVLALANANLEAIPRTEAPPRAPMPAFELAAGEVEITAPVDEPIALVLFATPPRFSPGYEEASLARFVALTGLNLLAKPPREGGDRPRWGVMGLGGPQAPVTAFVVEVEEVDHLRQVIKDGLHAIERSAEVQVDNPQSGEAYDELRQQRRLAILRNVANLGSRSEAYADYLDHGEAFHGAELAAIDDLTAAGVQQASRTVFDPDEARVIRIVPGDAAPELERADLEYEPKHDEEVLSARTIDPAEAERPLPYEDIVPPELEMLELELDNGMDVVLVRSTAFPLIDARLIVHGGTLDAPEPVLPELAVRLYELRAGSEEAGLLATYFNRSGSELYVGVTEHVAIYQASGLSIYMDYLLAGLSERVVQGEYGHDFSGWKQRTLEWLEKPEVEQALARERAFLGALYGEDHPFLADAIHDPERLRRLRSRDVRRYHDQHYRADNCTLVIVGGFDLSLATEHVRAFFETPRLRRTLSPWQEPRETLRATTVPEPSPGDTRVITEVDRERIQTTVTLSFPLAATFGDDHAALMVLASMLDGEVAVVRDELAASYGVYAGLVHHPSSIRISGAIDSKRAGEGLQAILAGVQRLRDGEGLEQRFALARRLVLRSLVDAQGDAALLTDQLTTALARGQSPDYFQQLARRVATLEPDAVRGAIERVLPAARSVLLVRGPATGVEDALERNGITDALALPEVVPDEP